MGSNMGGIAGLKVMRYKLPPQPRPPTPYSIFRGGELKEDHEVKKYKDEVNWLEDENEIQKVKEFDWKPALSIARKLSWVVGIGWFLYKLTSM
jgi:hypothetical protein